MAIEKTFNVRIKNKIHDWDSWIANDPVLLQGEPAFVEVAIKQEGEVNSVPSVMMKVGDGTHKFSELGWLYAKASNVYDWATAKDKPTYAATEITGMEDYISTYVNEQMGISVDTDTQYKLVKIDDYNYKLQAKGKTDAAWVDVADSVIVIPNDTASIEALEALVGDTAVATQISTAVTTESNRAKQIEADLELRLKAVEDDYLTSTDKEALQTQINTIINNPDTENVINSINEFTQYIADHGTVAEGFRTDIDANTKAIGDEESRAKGVESGLQNAINAINNETTGILSQAKEYADSKDTAISNAQTTATNAQTAAANAQSDVDAVEGRMDTAEAAIDALETLVGDTAVATQISNAIKDLSIGDYAKAADLEAAVIQHGTDKTALETAIAKKANSADLANVAKSGLMEDLSIGAETTIIFDCGTSAI